MERLYLTYDEHGRHIQYADINEDNYVCNVESTDNDSEEIVHRCNVHDQLVKTLKKADKFIGNLNPVAEPTYPYQDLAEVVTDISNVLKLVKGE